MAPRSSSLGGTSARSPTGRSKDEPTRLQLQFIRDTIDNNAVMVQTSYAGMPWKEAERNLRCFAELCLPELKKWETDPLGEPAGV